MKKIKVIKKGEVKKVETKVEVIKEVKTENWLEESQTNIKNQKTADLICRNNWFGK